ncbi:heptaprenyl diphosphate synthase component II [Planococcus shenhongbingii]|uniref:Heptaprenyl diphosphate synthase component II n=1 Tax=Planococcus shenhongbingii TaxID=3058398 RepID=A0ABT8N926_9BACL|nr:MULTISPECIES: heptaprenyl diphosphate synthase component II [unclassified Planococcus (in: firmicutes)]MDN7244055.1 heptaprenyl diphosphate synthase component II [Planococcus sp. N017]WKA57232.1 heptaprenyl diphosphate synthase component II [Planococcus sp. N016]
MEKVKLKLLYSDLKPELDMIEKELEQAVDSKSHLLNDASLHLLQAGGKRIRPVFVLLAGKFGNYNIDVMKQVAVPLELIHMASLVHDDVIDDSDIRRGKPTVKAEWNNSVAMYTGDFILARALEYITDIDSPKLHHILSKTMIEVCRGEIIQIEDKYKLDQNLRDYLRRIKRKTALLISSSCELGALVSGTDEKTAAHLRRFGYFIGMSFQIIDDILDFTSTDEELGKPAGSDFIQGNITLPVLCARRDPEVYSLLKNSLQKELTDKERLLVVKTIRNSPGISEAKAVSERYLKKALQELDYLPKSPANKTMRKIAFFIGKRKF